MQFLIIALLLLIAGCSKAESIQSVASPPIIATAATPAPVSVAQEAQTPTIGYAEARIEYDQIAKRLEKQVAWRHSMEPNSPAEGQQYAPKRAEMMVEINQLAERLGQLRPIIERATPYVTHTRP